MSVRVSANHPHLGLACNWQRGGGHEVQRRWSPRAVLQEGEVRRAIAADRRAEHGVTGDDVSDLVTYLVNDPRHLLTCPVRKLTAHRAAANLPVDRIDPDRPHDDADLIGGGMWIGQLHHLQNLGAELAELNRSHHSRLPAPSRTPMCRSGHAARQRWPTSVQGHDGLD